MAIHKKFGVRTSADDENNRENFHSVNSLAAEEVAGDLSDRDDALDAEDAGAFEGAARAGR